MVFDFPEKFYFIKGKVGSSRDKEKRRIEKGWEGTPKKVILVHENVNIQKSSFYGLSFKLEVQEKVHLREENLLLPSITEVAMRNSWRKPREH